jgi:hypothetical protein
METTRIFSYRNCLIEITSDGDFWWFRHKDSAGCSDAWWNLEVALSEATKQIDLILDGPIKPDRSAFIQMMAKFGLKPVVPVLH